MEIKNIIFDFGGVLMDWDPRYMYRNVFDNETEMEFFLENICNSEWNVKQDAGRSFDEATEELVLKFPKYENQIRIYFSRWIEMIGGAIDENVVLIEDLKDKYRLFGLTNWSAETFPLVFNEYPFFKELEGIVVSGTEKIVKPDASIYKLLLNRYGLTANESLFIDDNKENIIAANKLGFKTIHLSEKVNLKEEFKKLAL
ncbi:HAD family phosphatase [Ancylomarina sp. 16SWW S1-10-2]|uniref:HAD family hydrolase n=1 Tax=Ancylomarina sp. 16SWW S1-10-2 TaxID=2499681 RepID=UPI0012AEA11C|nr:HAD family phosphatase [Ancylomarina sp. 16SWW S1-10-2]MRT92805.1 HAD family phosphatase [Ancylomarina sp. 16SWW S1-10-2]